MTYDQISKFLPYALIVAVIAILLGGCIFIKPKPRTFIYPITFPQQDKLDYQISFDVNIQAKDTYKFYLNFLTQDTNQRQKAFKIYNQGGLPGHETYASIILTNEQNKTIFKSNDYKTVLHFSNPEVMGIELNMKYFELKPGKYHAIIKLNSHDPYDLHNIKSQIELTTRHKSK